MISKIINQRIHESILYYKLKKAVLGRSVNEGFYKEFLKAKLYVKAKKQQSGDISFELVNEEFLAFTSIDCLKRADQKREDFIITDTDFLLKSIPDGRSLVLNPGPNYGKVFLYNEIQDILAGRFSESSSNRFEIKQDTKVLIGQPKEYPAALVEALIEYLSKNGNVCKAYLAWVKFENEEFPHIMIGMKLSKNSLRKYDELVPELGEIAQSKIKMGEYVDFIEIKENAAGINEYMVNKIKPFYDIKRDS